MMTLPPEVIPTFETQDPPEILRPGSKVVHFGGLSGTGRIITLELLKLGISVVAGTRTDMKVEDFRAKLDDGSQSRLTPLVGDVTDTSAILAALDKEGVSLSNSPVIYSAAGGMESYSSRLLRGILGIARMSPSNERDKRLLDFQGKMALEAQKSIKDAMEINCNAPKRLIEHMIQNGDPTQKKPFVFLTSLGSSFFGTSYPVPDFYDGVAESKQAFEIYLTENAERLIKAGIYPVIVSGNLLQDSGVAMMMKALNKLAINDMVNLDDYPKMEDLARAAVGALTGEIQFDRWPGRVYVLKNGQISLKPPGQESYQDLLRIPFFQRGLEVS